MPDNLLELARIQQELYNNAYKAGFDAGYLRGDMAGYKRGLSDAKEVILSELSKPEPEEVKP